MLVTVCSELQHRPFIAATKKRIRTMESFLAMGSIEFPPISDPMGRSAVDLLAVLALRGLASLLGGRLRKFSGISWSFWWS